MDFTFIHCADVHLDTPLLARKDDLRRRLRDSTYRAFHRLTDLALDHQARFVLIAGDLFDTDILSYATQLRILRDLERLSARGVRVLIAPGNHDPATTSSFYRKARLPDGVHVFQSLQPETVAIEEGGTMLATVYGCGFSRKAVSENLAVRFQRKDAPGIHIAVLHASLVDSPSASEHEVYAPCTIGDLLHSGVDYWALGHIHKREIIHEDPWVVYPGNVHGRHFRETGPKGCYVVQVKNGRVDRIDFQALAPVVFESLAISVEDWANFGKLSDAIARAKDSAAGQVTDETQIVLRLILSGRSALWRELGDLASTEEQLAELCGDYDIAHLELDTQKVLPPVERSVLKQAPHALGAVLRMIDELRTKPDEQKQLIDEISEAYPELKQLPREEADAFLLEALDAAERNVVRLLYAAGD